ncbi:biotin transporter BioY [Rhizomicrobium electricum]|uniref:Biotin transporter n=1 Tax=Rhizomicrobium electricum TaxID=480070 RepID=A0ABN1E0C4_9PROT|nr:biotin transporter BioY [Rhizomicrobium electricum]NIJ47331.1 biotin transport system substrate-specific component [Rhizomicrobium electricum]
MFSPAIRLNNGVAMKALTVLAGTGILTASSYIQVPFYPVPMTMQTLAVTLVGAVLGWRLGAATVVAWLLAAAAGLPVLAGDHLTGPAVFIGPTAGYLLAFPLMAALTGFLAERGWTGKRPLLAFASMVAGNGLCLVLGTAWLSVLVGPEKAIALGMLPFLAGGLVKSALAAAFLKAIGR